jgi:predicted secreted protein
MDASEERETLEAVTGQEVEVALESFPGSGAIWHHHNAAPEILEFLGETRTATDESIGGAVRQSFRFRADRPGSYELSFELKRPWEREVRRRKTILVRVA